MLVLWLKALHLIAMVAWFAGMFYMFRLFVYHVENRDHPEVTALLKIMAARLYRYITTPAMIATFVFGIAMLVANPGYLKLGWVHLKLVLVLGLAGYHGFVGATRAVRPTEGDSMRVALASGLSTASLPSTAQK